MQQETAIAKAKTREPSPKMESQDLHRRACTGISRKLEKLVIKSTSNNNNPRPDATTTTNDAFASASEQQQVVETVRCACCSVAEDCTAAYIAGVRASFCGDWLCGLCAEAVKEIVRHDPAADTAAALVSHEAECRDFNATTRLNPALSLAGSMRRIARRSFDRRRAASSCQEEGGRGGGLGGQPAAAAALARSASCDPWLLDEVMRGRRGGDRCR